MTDARCLADITRLVAVQISKYLASSMAKLTSAVTAAFAAFKRHLSSSVQ
jgi:hypothetical protein